MFVCVCLFVCVSVCVLPSSSKGNVSSQVISVLTSSNKDILQLWLQYCVLHYLTKFQSIEKRYTSVVVVQGLG